VKKENTRGNSTFSPLVRNKKIVAQFLFLFVYLFPVKRRILAGKIARANQNGGKISST
jgi:hypothetical protein